MPATVVSWNHFISALGDLPMPPEYAHRFSWMSVIVCARNEAIELERGMSENEQKI